MESLAKITSANGNDGYITKFNANGGYAWTATFVGRGDMSRGGLLLRHARSGVELDYLPLRGATRHGARPPRLLPVPRATHRSSSC